MIEELKPCPEMIEKVARAIAACDNEDGFDAWEDNPSERGRRVWFEYARAAIAAYDPDKRLREALKIAEKKSCGHINDDQYVYKQRLDDTHRFLRDFNKASEPPHKGVSDRD